MAKPHEETWSLECFQTLTPIPAGICIRTDSYGNIEPAVLFPRSQPPTYERALLATQAPAMARLLLKVLEELPEWWHHAEAEKILKDAGVIKP